MIDSMKKQYFLFTLFLAGLVFSSCASKKTILFTQDLREKIASFEIDIADVQFYNSHKITLERSLSYEEAKIASGKIRFEKGRYIEIITIKKHTPGVCEMYDESAIRVAFESGENRDLTFVRNPKDFYQIYAQ